MAGTQPILDRILISPNENFNEYYEFVEPLDDPDDTTVTLEVYSKDWADTLAVFSASVVEEGGARFNVMASDWLGIPSWSRFRIYINYPDIGPKPMYKGSIVKV